MSAQHDYALLAEKANNLARLVESMAYTAVSYFYGQRGNPAPLKLLRIAVAEVDVLTKKGGARGVQER